MNAAPDGMPVAWCLASPKIGEREVAAALLDHARRNHALRPGLILIGDKGFAGREFEQLVTGSFRMRLVRPDRRDEVPRHGSIGWIRQWIESIFDTLKGQLSLEEHGARTDHCASHNYTGVRLRIRANLPAEIRSLEMQSMRR